MSILTTKIIKAPKDCPNISEFFNQEFLKLPRSDIYGFLVDGDNLYPRTVRKVREVFEKDISLVGVVYFDKYLVKQNNTIHNKNDSLMLQIYPQFEVNSKLLFNPTIFVNGHINVPIFDPSLEHLRSYDVLQKLSKQTKIIHIPEILMTSNYVSLNIEEEYKKYVSKTQY